MAMLISAAPVVQAYNNDVNGILKKCAASTAGKKTCAAVICCTAIESLRDATAARGTNLNS